MLGTDQFMSPEILSADENNTYGYEVDMWAFGVLFYFMLNMEYPFSNYILKQELNLCFHKKKLPSLKH